MSTYTQILYHIVFSTKNRAPVLAVENRKELYRYIWGILSQKKCHLYRIGGVEDHLHIIMHLHPEIALSQLIKDIKIASSKHIKKNGLFDHFGSWQQGYGAFTHSYKEKDKLINYVKNQEDHHKIKTFKEEYVELLLENKIEFKNEYLN